MFVHSNIHESNVLYQYTSFFSFIFTNSFHSFFIISFPFSFDFLNFSIGFNFSSSTIFFHTARWFLYSFNISDILPHLYFSATIPLMIYQVSFSDENVGKFEGAGKTLYCIHSIALERLYVLSGK